MREVGREPVEVMRLLGYDTFAVVGHDRGARCAYRMALDHPDTVTRLAVLDIVPTSDAFGRADMDFSLGFWLRSFLAAPEPVPEVHAVCEQYRAAATLDYQHDETDRGNRRIRCPVRALWSHAGPVAS